MQTAFNPSYIGSRHDVIKLIPDTARSILDVGCSNGELGKQIKDAKGATVHGIEIDPQMSAIAQQRLDKVITANVQNVFRTGDLGQNLYDTIIFADILEHLVDPWSVLRESLSYLSAGGTIIASIPNIRHISTIHSLLLKGYWPYRNRGIHDRTHMRFFTKKNIKELFRSAELRIVRMGANYRIIEKPSRLNVIARFFAIPPFRGVLAYQYLIRAQALEKESTSCTGD